MAQKSVNMAVMKRKIIRDPGVEHAIKAAGDTLTALAAALGISKAAIAKWRQVPLGRVEQIEETVPGTSRYAMRPDHFGEMEL